MSSLSPRGAIRCPAGASSPRKSWRRSLNWLACPSNGWSLVERQPRRATTSGLWMWRKRAATTTGSRLTSRDQLESDFFVAGQELSRTLERRVLIHPIGDGGPHDAD